MTHPAPIAPSEPPLWTLQRMDLFIRTLQRTRNVAAAARAAGMSRNAAYKLRARLRGYPFDGAWEAAVAPATQIRRIVREHERGAGLQGVTPGDRG